MVRRAEGPWFEELRVGDVFDKAPPHTLTPGRQAVHQAIVGDRLLLPLSDATATRVAGGPVAHPALVWDVAIGQSTIATQHVKANLFYRNLAFHRLPLLGDTMRTTTTVVGLRENSRRNGRAPTGLVALRMVTVDQRERVVLDFYRCAMLPLKKDVDTGRHDNLELVGIEEPKPDLLACLSSVDITDLPKSRQLPIAGERIEVVGGDVVTSAPELARLTLNIASVHHDQNSAGGRRLVYGGHTIGVALSQATRAIPDIITVLGWHSCDHLGPVFEGDTLYSELKVEGCDRGPCDANIVHLRSQVRAEPVGHRPVLDWHFVVLVK